MQLIANWRAVLLRAWSMRLMFLAAVLSGIESALPSFADLFPPNLFGALTALVVSAAMVARMIPQPSLAPEEPADAHEEAGV